MTRGAALVVAAASVASVALVLGTPRAADAGGAVWKFERASYLPGDQAVAHTTISWAHNPALGTPADGPFFAYLAPAQPGAVAATVAPDAQPVAEIVVTEGFPSVATIAFTVPDLPYGVYDVLHCNVPCTTTLADLIRSQLWVGVTPPPPAPLPPLPPPAAAPVPEPVADDVAPSPERAARAATRAASDGTTGWRSWLGPGVLALVAALGAVVLARRVWRRPPAR